MEWIKTLGGPFVVMPHDWLSLWTGANGPNGEDDWDEDDTLYDQVSEVARDYADTFQVEGREVLVVSNGYAPTAYLPDLGLLVQQLSQGVTEPDLLAYVRRLLPAVVWKHETMWAVDGGALIMFDSVNYGPDMTESEWLPLPIRRGQYRVRCTYIESRSDDEPYLSLVRFESL